MTVETVPLAVVYALADEVKPFLKEASIGTKIIQKPAIVQFGTFRGLPVVFCRTGLGLANAHEAAEHLLERARPSLILSLGCAGAAHPDLQSGDLILASEIRSETPTDRFPTSEKDRNDLERLIREEDLPYRTGPLMTLWKIAGKAAKEEAGSKGAACVDMETAAVAAIAEKAAVPIVSLRAIFDPMEEELPFTEPFDEDHPIRFLFRNPAAFLRVPKYARWNRLCQSRLFRVVARFIDSHPR